MYITDKQTVKSRFDRNFESYNQQATVQQHIANKLANLLVELTPNNYKRILEIGCGTGFLTRKMIANQALQTYFLNDLADTAFHETCQHLSLLDRNKTHCIAGDAETISLPDNIDAIVSTSTFQWFNNLESFIAKANYLLNSEGIFAFSSFGKTNFSEIRSVLNVGLDYKSLDETVQSVKPYFEILHAEEWLETLPFQQPIDVLKHMKLTGVNSVGSSFFGKEKLSEFTRNYQQNFSTNDKSVTLTYHPIIIIAKKQSHA